MCVYIYILSAKLLGAKKNFLIVGEGSCEWDEELPIKQRSFSGEPANKGMFKELVTVTALPHHDAAQIPEGASNAYEGPIGKLEPSQSVVLNSQVSDGNSSQEPFFLFKRLLGTRLWANVQRLLQITRSHTPMPDWSTMEFGLCCFKLSPIWSNFLYKTRLKWL